jgi:hypothetical protein
MYGAFNMAASLIKFLEKNKDLWSGFLWSVGEEAGDIYGRMSVQYGDKIY